MSERPGSPGLHHVTAISGDPQRVLDFWGDVLGLRLVKRTVNFDDVATYHFYFGDDTGRPGTIVTFFPWGAQATPGRQGVGQCAVFALSIPPGSMGWWIERLLTKNIPYEPITRRFDEQVLALRDPDGLAIELVAHAGEGAGHAIRGLHAVTLWEEKGGPTGEVLETLGFRLHAEEDAVRRYAAGDGGPGTFVDVREVAGFWKGQDGAGAVHHVAFRVPDDATELALRERVIARGLQATEPLDRQYFRSVYFREPGGVLFELATDGPGFATDEPLDSLGARLSLPAWLERDRASLEAYLPEIHLPGSAYEPGSAFRDAPPLDDSA